MTEATKLPIKTETETKESAPPAKPREWRPFESLRREVDRLFDEFDTSAWRYPFGGSAFDVEPLWRRGLPRAALPAIDIAKKDGGYEITAEVPGMDESNIEVKVAGGALTIKGEKKEETEKKEKDFYLSERRYGAFERTFRVPEGVDADKIEASFKKGVLKITLPKSAEAAKNEKKIAIKAA